MKDQQLQLSSVIMIVIIACCFAWVVLLLLHAPWSSSRYTVTQIVGVGSAQELSDLQTFPYTLNHPPWLGLPNFIFLDYKIRLILFPMPLLFPDRVLV